MVPPVTNRHNILPDSPSGWPEELRKINCGRKNVAAVMSATAKFMRRKLIEVLGKISEINAISRRKIKTLFVKDICRLGHKSSFFLSPCGTRWSADMCRWNSFKQGTTLFPGLSPTRLRREPWERGWTGYILLLLTGCLWDWRLLNSAGSTLADSAVYIYRTNGTNAF